MESGRRLVVGVNAFATDGTQRRHEVFRPDPGDRQVAIERCRQLKLDRDSGRVTTALARVQAAAADPDAEIFPALVEAAAADATIGEMIGALTSVFGGWLEPSVLATGA